MANRAARILHTIVKALEGRGYGLTVRRCYSQYSPGWSEVRTYILYAEEEIQVSLMERANRFEKTSTNSPYNWGPKYDYVPSGLLYIETSFRGWYSGKQNWSDSLKRER